nr:hypothetical protein [Pseudovibrio ascidiaceicola]
MMKPAKSAASENGLGKIIIGIHRRANQPETSKSRSLCAVKVKFASAYRTTKVAAMNRPELYEASKKYKAEKTIAKNKFSITVAKI